MKTFDELTLEQQEKAVEKEAIRLVEYMAEGYPPVPAEFKDVVDETWDEMSAMSTPWFFGQVLWERAEAELKNWVRELVEAQLFAEEGDPEVVWGICQ